MNRVGPLGRGESVWMGFFLAHVIDQLLPLAQARADAARVAAWRAARIALAAALDSQAWDGAWYRRGWFDDGSVLGSHSADECRIDLIVQAWAVLTGAAQPARAQQALHSAWQELHDPDAHLLRLLWPPLQHHQPPAGYIQAYPPGVRENGGQYNHGAVWALMACTRLGWAAPAWQAFTAISPAHRSATPQGRAVYGIEPYVVAGDVESVAPHAGRGGWSWYTGAAGWLLRAGVESLLGVRVEAGLLLLQPCLPPHWPSAQVTLRLAGPVARVVRVHLHTVHTAPMPGALWVDAGATVALADLPADADVHVRIAPAAKDAALAAPALAAEVFTTPALAAGVFATPALAAGVLTTPALAAEMLTTPALAAFVPANPPTSPHTPPPPAAAPHPPAAGPSTAIPPASDHWHGTPPAG